MFMTDCDLVYGRNTSTQSNNTTVIAPKTDSESSAEKGKGMETTAKAAKAFLGAHVAAAKFAGGAVSKLSKKAVDYAKSNDAAEKMNFVKDKAGAAFAGIKGKAAALAPVADEYDTVENYDISPNETVYQNNEKDEYGTHNSPAPTLNVSQNQGYIIQKHKTNTILIIVIIVLVLVVGVLSGMMFMMNRKDTPEPSGSNNAESKYNTLSHDNTEISVETDFSELEPTENRDESSDEGSSVMDKTIAPEDSLAENKPSVSAEDKKKAEKAYMKTLTDFTKTEDFNAYDYASKFALYDVNGDGIDELIIQYMCTIGNAERMYYYKNGSYNEILYCAESSFEICPTDHLVQYYGYGGGEARFVSEIDSRGVTIDELIKYPNNTYERNNTGIYKSEYDEAMEYYDSFKWIKPSFNLFNTVLPDSIVKAKPRAYDPFMAVVSTKSTSLNVRELPSTDAKIIGDIPKDTYITAYKLEGYPDWYKVEYSEKDIVGYSSARYIIDYETYEKALDKSEFIALGKVITKNDPLNMRSSADTDSEIIYKIPKGHYVGIISYNGDWFYVKYFADVNSPVYYGYVSSDYIEITERY